MIYFLQEVEEPHRIKLGYSANPLQRIKIVAGHLPQKVRLLKIITGEKIDESFYHEHLRSFRVPKTREWYVPDPQLMDFIDTKGEIMFLPAFYDVLPEGKCAELDFDTFADIKLPNFGIPSYYFGADFALKELNSHGPWLHPEVFRIGIDQIELYKKLIKTAHRDLGDRLVFWQFVTPSELVALGVFNLQIF